MEVAVRNALMEDAAAIARLSGQLGYAANQQAIETRLANLFIHPDNCVFVAVQNDEIVGWIHGFYTLRVESDAFVEIAGLVVDERLRNKGIGKQLIALVSDWSKSRHCFDLRVRCNAVRLASHKFYERSGFTLKKEQKIFNKTLS